MGSNRGCLTIGQKSNRLANSSTFLQLRERADPRPESQGQSRG